MRRAFTLIELMIGTAILGILAALADTTLSERRGAIEIERREKALIWVEAEADAVIAGTPLPDDVRARLHATLPEATFGTLTTSDGLTELVVQWSPDGARPRRVSLSVARRTP